MSERGFACIFRSGGSGGSGIGRVLSDPADKVTLDPATSLKSLAEEFSPRFEADGARSITIDVSGLGRLLGSFHAIGVEMVREASARGLDVHVAVAGTCTAARLLARTRPGLTVVPPGEEAAALAPLRFDALGTNSQFLIPNSQFPSVLSKWGIRTLGAFAALPAADIRSRFGRSGAELQAIARGEDVRPLVPDRPEERFDAALDLEWPIEGLEPLSFVLTRLLEPLSTRLERRDRAAAVLHVALGLVPGVSGEDSTRDTSGPGDVHARRLEFPTPLREVRTLRTLALLDMESHPPGGPIERVTVTIEPTPGRVLQHTLFSRAEPTPDEISTLLARLAALLGAGRIGSPVAVDSYRPGAFAVVPFNPGSQRFYTGAGARQASDSRLQASDSGQRIPNSQFLIPPIPDPRSPIPVPQSVLRRFRQPVPVRVTVENGRPIRIVADRRGFGDSRVVSTAGPWRSSGNWWVTERAGEAGTDRAGKAGGAGRAGRDEMEPHSSCHPHPPAPSHLPYLPHSPYLTHSWDHEEWDVAMADGAVYRMFREPGAGGWFLEAIVD